MTFQDRALWVTLLSFLFIVGSAGAQTEVHLIYPQPWCQSDDSRPLYFTLARLGVSDTSASLASLPSHGEVFLVNQPAESGYYLPECAGFLRAGFDFFQVKSDTVDGFVNVVVHASEGAATEHVAEERIENGELGEGWTFGGGSAVRIVEWPGSDGLEGTHGLHVDGAQVGDSYVAFAFPGASRVLQPPEVLGDNQGTVTTVIIRPPVIPPYGNRPNGEQIIYGAGDFASGAAPDTALRLRSIEGVLSVRAEASIASFENLRVLTPWCELAEAKNEIEVHHRHSLGDDALLKLTNVAGDIEVCSHTVTGFTSAGTAAAEHRFGIMEPQEGGVAFDFDDMRIESARYEPELVSEIMDDFEAGSWSSLWEVIGNGSDVDVAPEASHTGFWGLRIRPKLDSSSFLLLRLPAESSDFGCHFSLGGGEGIAATPAIPPRDLVFSARGAGGDRVRLWVRTVASGYQIRAHSGPNDSGWLPLLELPASLDLRWRSGLLELWIDGCGPDPEHCGVGHQVSTPTMKTANRFRLGDIHLTEERPESIGVDNVLCLRRRTSE